MFVLKSKYERLEKKFKSEIAYRDNVANILREKLQECSENTLPEGKRLTKDELSTLIAVDLISVLVREREGGLEYEVLNNLYDGLFFEEFFDEE